MIIIKQSRRREYIGSKGSMVFRSKILLYNRHTKRKIFIFPHPSFFHKQDCYVIWPILGGSFYLVDDRFIGLDESFQVLTVDVHFSPTGKPNDGDITGPDTFSHCPDSQA